VSKSKNRAMGVFLAAAAGLAIAGAHGKAASTLDAAGMAMGTGTPASTSSAVALGRRMAAQRGWTGTQFDCLDALWTRESDWNDDAVETTSIDGQPPTYAYGIPQANPADFGHPFPLGDARAQVAWGLRYVAARYGSPCGAWDHEVARGWY
jgi:resuscitation-promoting factor RpfB